MKAKLYIILHFIIVCGLGILSHFLYDWSGQNVLVGFFTSINESTWEHLKLLFFPMVFISILETLLFKKKLKDFIPARTFGILSGMAFIIIVFYTFWGISGKLIDFVNVTIYIMAVYFAFRTEKFLRDNKKLPDLCICIAILISITLLFIIFTLHSPEVGIFYDLSLHPKG